MHVKLYGGLVAALAGAALAAGPAIAQAAPPHWTSNGTVIPAGQTVAVSTHGAIRFKFGTNAVKCKIHDTGTVQNPTGGGAGVDSVTTITFSECTSKTLCAVGVTPAVTAEKTPWASKLIEEPEGTLPKDEISGIGLTLACGAEVKESFTGALTAEVKTSKTGGGALVFKTGSGTLAGSKGGTLGVSSGKDALSGTVAKEKITAH